MYIEFAHELCTVHGIIVHLNACVCFPEIVSCSCLKKCCKKRVIVFIKLKEKVYSCFKKSGVKSLRRHQPLLTL